MHALVYSDHWVEKTVTIDYNPSLHQFLTEKEKHPFSAERLLRMLNGWAKIDRIDTTPVGQLHIAAEDAHCVLTLAAINTLSHLYRQRRDWQAEYPFVSRVFGSCAGGDMMALPPLKIQADVLFRSAQRLAGRDRYDSALLALDQAIEQESTARLYDYRGMLLALLLRTEEAL